MTGALVADSDNQNLASDATTPAPVSSPANGPVADRSLTDLRHFLSSQTLRAEQEAEAAFQAYKAARARSRGIGTQQLKDTATLCVGRYVALCGALDRLLREDSAGETAQEVASLARQQAVALRRWRCVL